MVVKLLNNMHNVLPKNGDLRLLNNFILDNAPFAGLQFSERNIPDLHADEAKRGEADGGCHVADLAVFAFDEC